MRRIRQEATVHGWLKALPDEVVRVRPVLSVASAAALLSGGELESVEGRLREAEQCLDAMTGTGEGPQARPTEMVVDDGRRGCCPRAWKRRGLRSPQDGWTSYSRD
jgi:LuxR family transcriptional regulator, maltose regulon positive regulatory protein